MNSTTSSRAPTGSRCSSSPPTSSVFHRCADVCSWSAFDQRKRSPASPRRHRPRQSRSSDRRADLTRRGGGIPHSRCPHPLSLADIGFDALTPTLRSTLTGPRHTTSVLSSASAQRTWSRLGIWPNGVAPTRGSPNFVAENGHFRLAGGRLRCAARFPRRLAGRRRGVSGARTARQQRRASSRLPGGDGGRSGIGRLNMSRPHGPAGP